MLLLRLIYSVAVILITATTTASAQVEIIGEPMPIPIESEWPRWHEDIWWQPDHTVEVTLNADGTIQVIICDIDVEAQCRHMRPNYRVIDRSTGVTSLGFRDIVPELTDSD